jgi:hypothetical protein
MKDITSVLGDSPPDVLGDLETTEEEYRLLSDMDGIT